MNKPGLHVKALPFLALTMILVFATACNVPFISQKTSTPAASPSAGTPGPTATSGTSGISPAILTEVAATLYAPYQATWTLQAATNAGTPNIPPPGPVPTKVAGATPATPLTEPAPAGTIQAPVQPTAASVVTLAAPEETQAEYAIPTAAVTWAPGYEVPYATPVPAEPPIYYPPVPPMNLQIYPGQGFKVLGVNLPPCGGIPSANFYIFNRDTVSLESLQLKFTDLTTSSILLGPVTSDTPFMLSDRVCLGGGIERLASGQALFLGNTLSLPNLTGHTIQADISLCTADGLGGKCYLKTVSFVVP